MPGWTKIAVVLAVLLGVRIEIFRQVTVYSECASAVGYQYTIPFCLALYDYFRDVRNRPVDKYVPPDEQPINITVRLLYKYTRRTRHYLLRGRHRYLISAGLVSLAGMFVATLRAGRFSTYICPTVSSTRARIPAFQMMGAVIDIVLLMGLAEIAREWVSSSMERRRTISYHCGSLILGIAFVWTVVGFILNRKHAYGAITFSVYGNYVGSVVGQGILVTGLFVSASQLVSVENFFRNRSSKKC